MNRRNTPGRTEILNLLKASGTALSQDMISSALEVDLNKVTIYRILARLQEDELVHQIQGDDGIRYYALCSKCDEHHHNHDHFHFRCLSCGLVQCLENTVVVSLPQGYVSQEINAVVMGKCASCG